MSSDNLDGFTPDQIANGERREATFKKPPKAITREHFIEMLEVLPPKDWQRSPLCESFKLSEYTSGRITSIFARIGNTYFQMADSFTLSHDAIIEACFNAHGEWIDASRRI